MSQKILIVDDSPDIHELISASLTSADLEFYSVADGASCILEAPGLAPDLILLDVDMPVMNGFEVCRALKSASATASIPVIFLTGASSTQEKLEGLALGAVDYITKPFDAAELGARVASALHTQYLLDLLATQNKDLRQSEGRFRLLVDQAADAMLLWDATGRIIDVNRRACESLGYTRPRLLSMNLSQLEVGIDQQELAQIPARAAQGPLTLAGTHRRADGTEFPVEARIGLMEWAGQTLVLALARDISDRLHAEKLLLEQSHLREAVVAMEQVLGVVSHELRTPLAGIRMMAEFVIQQSPALSADCANFLGQVLSETIRLSDMVNSLLEAARLDSGKARWNWSEFTLESAARSAIETITPLVDAARVKVSMTVVPTGATVSGDADAIRRVLLNLLSNSIRHTTDGAIDVAIRRFTENGAAWCEIAVRDTGSGMPRHIQERLGEAFALNVGTVGAGNAAGAGLGLAICKAILTAHGGAFTVESEIGQGTTITARLRADLAGPVTSDTINLTPLPHLPKAA
jgi:PAS domain S-box-containing protein